MAFGHPYGAKIVGKARVSLIEHPIGDAIRQRFLVHWINARRISVVTGTGHGASRRHHSARAIARNGRLEIIEPFARYWFLIEDDLTTRYRNGVPRKSDDTFDDILPHRSFEHHDIAAIGQRAENASFEWGKF